jgi:CheY-like chemotaxis protein
MIIQTQVVSLKEALENRSQPWNDAAKPIVLVVDDEPIVADTLSTILTQSGYATLTAYDGASALDIARLFPPALLITDVAMPGMNGIQLALALVRGNPSCQVLLFSGNATTGDLMGAQVSAHHFPLISKPIHPIEMLNYVAGFLDSASAARPAHPTEISLITQVRENA